VLVERVIRILEIGVAKHEQEDQQTLIRPGSDEGILLPGPVAEIFEVADGRPEPSAGFLVRTLRVSQRKRLQEINGWLVIPERPQ